MTRVWSLLEPQARLGLVLWHAFAGFITFGERDHGGRVACLYSFLLLPELAVGLLLCGTRELALLLTPMASSRSAAMRSLSRRCASALSRRADSATSIFFTTPGRGRRDALNVRRPVVPHCRGVAPAQGQGQLRVTAGATQAKSVDSCQEMRRATDLSCSHLVEQRGDPWSRAMSYPGT
jgi:hypothetical protein